MAYRRSIPLQEWFDAREVAIATLATAHATMGEVDGPGRPREIGRPVAHAYILRLVAEFQAFVRDLHNLGAERLVELSEPRAQYRPLLVAGATEGRFIDRGNADVRSVARDFRRLGIGGLRSGIANHNVKWSPEGSRGDQAYYQDLIELRNALAHGNQGQLDTLRRRGVADTVSWSRARLPGLRRIARSLDRVVWEHLHSTFGVDPWRRAPPPYN